MEKDIADLLDEVDRKFVNNPKMQQANSSLSSEQLMTAVKSKPRTPNKLSNALDDVIDDILDIDVSEEKNTHINLGKDHQVRSVISNEINKSDKSRRCFPVFLGGSIDSMGRSSTASNRSCDQLRCTSCDFRVSCFENMSWSKDTDYLFLRNNVPDFQKLKSKLTRKNGCRAYCCQCSWRNVLELCELTDPTLKWVCGKHTS